MESYQRNIFQRSLLLVILLPLSGVLCFSELFFIREPQDVTVLWRHSVVLDCQSQGEAPIAVQWLKDGLKVHHGDRFLLLSNGSLHISEVESNRGMDSDEGFYQCLAQNQYGSILSQKARLTVATAPAFVVQPASVLVAEGSVGRLFCTVTANPPATITWEFNETTLLQTTNRITVLPSGVLQIQGVNLGDAGRYRCVATNIAGVHKSTEAVFVVNTGLELKLMARGPRIIAGPQNLTVAQHGTAVLECLATGSPRPLISWSRADHTPMDVFNTKVLGTGNLVIADAKPQHAGIYVCRATTPGTRNYTVAMANLTVLAPPSLVEWPETLTRPRAGTARFMCKAEGVPEPHVTWLKNGERVHANGRIKMYNSKLVLNQIIPEDDAIYQCLAENGQGSVLATARLIVFMSEDRPSAPRNVRAETVSSSAVLLAWERPLYNAERVIAYSVHYMKSEGMNNEEYQVVIGNDTTRYIIDDLEPAHNYTFYMVAYMPVGASRMSEQVVQCTLEDVPLRAPELSLTSRSPTDMQVSWQPLPGKLSRGCVLAYRLSLRTAADSAVSLLELPGHVTQHHIKGLQPDTLYLVRISAATRVGWGEPCAWTSHRTPSASSTSVPLAPELRLEPLNCTTVAVRWQPNKGSSAPVFGYRLYYRQEGQADGVSVQLQAHDSQHTIGGLDPRRKYHIRLLAYNSNGEGYQADQTASTPACLSVRDRMVPPPPPPHHLQAKANSSSSVYLQWDPPVFAAGQAVSYTIRCHPVGLQNASLVRYLHTTKQSLIVQGLVANTRYEFAVRLHVEQMASPWSTVVYQSTLPEAPSRPPSGVKVTLIESDTALVSWKHPEEPNLAVTRYTILYASRKAWVAGEWQVLQREGSNTMALLENLLPGNVYLVRISASNQVGDGPFSSEVELAVLPTSSQANHVSGRFDGSTFAKAFTDSFYYMDQKSMLGIMVGVSIALACVLLCVLILVYRTRARKSFAPKMVRRGGGQSPESAAPLSGEDHPECVEALVQATGHHFIDAKGGTALIINSTGPVKPSTLKKKKWLFFNTTGKQQPKKEQRRVYSGCSYQLPGTVLRYEQAQPLSQVHATPQEVKLETEGSHDSQGTGDSGHYSHDEADVSNMVDVPGEGFDAAVRHHLMVELSNSMEMAFQTSSLNLNSTQQLPPL